MHVFTNTERPLKAYASIMYEGILINNIAVVERKDKTLMVAPPTVWNKRNKKKNKNYSNFSRIVNFYDKNEEISKVVMEAYNAEVQKQK